MVPLDAPLVAPLEELHSAPALGPAGPGRRAGLGRARGKSARARRTEHKAHLSDCTWSGRMCNVVPVKDCNEKGHE
eukprot:5359065-Alexandrium_andersonii.AAC.1